MTLSLEPYGSRVLTFTKRRLPASTVAAAPAGQPQSVDLSAGWNVSFGNNQPAVRMEALRSWTEDEATRFFSGVATYTKTVSVPADMTGATRKVVLDFGEGKPLPRAGARFQALLEPPVNRTPYFHSAYDPEHPDFTKYPGMAYVDRLEFVLEPGDVFFMPPSWWHHVRNLTGSIGTTSAIIRWSTNEAADTQAEIGTTTNPTSRTALQSALVTSHSVTFSNLAKGKKYYFRARSRDKAGNLRVSPVYSFTTRVY